MTPERIIEAAHKATRPRVFYRIQKSDQEGIWYNSRGRQLQPPKDDTMPHDNYISDLRSDYFSVVDSMESMSEYFGDGFINNLLSSGGELLKVISDDWFERGGHCWVNKHTAEIERL